MLTMAGFYVGSYVALSLCGGYVMTQSGDVRYADGGMSVTDIDQWQPCFTFYQHFRTMNGSRIVRANFLGYVYAPLILLDQTFFHRTVRHFDPLTGRPVP